MLNYQRVNTISMIMMLVMLVISIPCVFECRLCIGAFWLMLWNVRNPKNQFIRKKQLLYLLKITCQWRSGCNPDTTLDTNHQKLWLGPLGSLGPLGPLGRLGPRPSFARASHAAVAAPLQRPWRRDGSCIGEGYSLIWSPKMRRVLIPNYSLR